MIRKKKRYLKPTKMYESERIKEENILVKKYGLKNKTEIWKTLAKINYFRERAKALAKESPEEKNVLFSKLKAIGLNADSIADVLDLKVENLLERRLPTIVAKKGFASRIKQARQMVVHKKILVGDNIINSPSYIVPVRLENLIKVKIKKKKPKIEEKPVEEKKEEVSKEKIKSEETEEKYAEQQEKPEEKQNA